MHELRLDHGLQLGYRLAPLLRRRQGSGRGSCLQRGARKLLGYHAASEKAGHTGSRLAGEMTWVLRGWPGSERFLDAEARINRIDTAFPHVGMCMYDTRRFDGATLYRVLQVHPFIVAHGQIVRNPYYGGATPPNAPG